MKFAIDSPHSSLYFLTWLPGLNWMLNKLATHYYFKIGQTYSFVLQNYLMLTSKYNLNYICRGKTHMSYSKNCSINLLSDRYNFFQKLWIHVFLVKQNGKCPNTLSHSPSSDYWCSQTLLSSLISWQLEISFSLFILV